MAEPSVLTSADIRAAGGDPLARAASRVSALRALRYGDIPAGIEQANLPKIRSALNTNLIPNAVVVPRTSPLLTYGGGLPVQRGTTFPNTEYFSNRYITTPSGDKVGSSWSIRFMTDSPTFELVFGDYTSTINVFIDGRAVSPTSFTRSFTNTQNGVNILFTLGDDVQTIRSAITIAAGGTGYASGDIIRANGGTGVAAQIAVTDVDNAGAVTGFYVLDFGHYTVMPGNAATTTAVSGVGTGLTLNVVNSASPVLSRQLTRRMRRIEVHVNANGAFSSLRVSRNSLVRPWPFSGVRLMTMQDSYNATFQDVSRGTWSSRMAARLGIEDLWINGVGGTSFTQAPAGTSTFGVRLNDVIQNQPPAATPFIFLTQGSINEGAAASDAVARDAAQAYWTRAFAEMPNAFMVQTGILRARGNSPGDSRSNAIRDGFLAAQAVADPLGLRSGFIDTRNTLSMMTVGGEAGNVLGTGATDFYISGDAAHPTQDGQNFIGDVWAADLVGLISKWGE